MVFCSHCHKTFRDTEYPTPSMSHVIPSWTYEVEQQLKRERDSQVPNWVFSSTVPKVKDKSESKDEVKFEPKAEVKIKPKFEVKIGQKVEMKVEHCSSRDYAHVNQLSEASIGKSK